MLTAAVYARYSSSLQRPTSIADQVSRCREAAARFGCYVAGERVYADEELSGATAQRPVYQRLMEAAKRREFDAIIVEAQDRLWRDQAEMHTALRRLRFLRVKVFSVETGTDLTDKTGSIVAAVTGWRDETFLDSLRDKTHRGMAGQVGRGLSAGGRPYGYRSIPIHDPARMDPYGQPVVVGYRRIIDEQEAKVIRQVFEWYAEGLSSKAIVYRLNSQRIPPPRPKRGRAAQGWTWTTIAGSRKKGIGILNNEAYVGRLYWNKSRKEKDPDSGRRTTRIRSRDDWMCVEVPELRIVPNELWDRVKARQAEVAKQNNGARGGPRPKYLFSTLLRCGVCGAHYMVRDRKYYACSFNRNRGPHVCPNGKVVRRQTLEERLLAVIEREVFSPEALAYLTKRVNEALTRLRVQGVSERRALEAELRNAEEEMENIKTAIRRGVVTDTTKEMLEEAERKVRTIRANMGIAAEPKIAASIRVLPSLVENYLMNLRSVLYRDTDRARLMLSRLVGDIVLRPEEDGVVAEVKGNVGALLGVEFGSTNGAGRGI